MRTALRTFALIAIGLGIFGLMFDPGLMAQQEGSEDLAEALETLQSGEANKQEPAEDQSEQGTSQKNETEKDKPVEESAETAGGSKATTSDAEELTEKKSESSTEDNADGVLVPAGEDNKRVIYVIEIKQGIDRAIEFLVRRGLKDAIRDNADAVVIHMDTPGGSVYSTLEIMTALSKFKPADQTYTFIDDDAISGGAFVACATRHIYMNEGAIIGASAVITGDGQDLEETAKAKANAVLLAKVRSYSERNGHRPDVFASMVMVDEGLFIEGREVVKRGELAAFTTSEALKEYGGKPLLAAGKATNLDSFLRKLGGSEVEVKTYQLSSLEIIGSYLNYFAGTLIFLGLLCLYGEAQSPGFGVFGSIGLSLFALVFLGYFSAGLGGQEAIVFFLAGVVLIGVEVLVVPGMLIPGALGAGLVIGSLAYAGLDRWPNDWSLPQTGELIPVFGELAMSFLASIAVMVVIATILPRRTFFMAAGLDEATLSGSGREELDVKEGDTGETISMLRPSGTAIINGKRVDVLAEDARILKGKKVKIVSISEFNVTVREVADEESGVNS